MVALNAPAGVVVFVSVKVATAPLESAPRDRFQTIGRPERKSPGASVSALMTELAAEVPALDAATTQ
jgi:hypothetical protein